jgi:hypothetical protein
MTKQRLDEGSTFYHHRENGVLAVVPNDGSAPTYWDVAHLSPAELDELLEALDVEPEGDGA